jgi:hypothetical protein
MVLGSRGRARGSGSGSGKADACELAAKRFGVLWGDEVFRGPSTARCALRSG